MTALAVEQLAYRNPHPQEPGRHRLVGWFWDDVIEWMLSRDRLATRWEHYCPAFDPCETCAEWERQKARLGEGFYPVGGQPGWHGPLPADLHAEHVARERQAAEERHEAHIAGLTLDARRSANPMWQKVDDVLSMRCEDHGDDATDAVMDAIYGKGQW